MKTTLYLLIVQSKTQREKRIKNFSFSFSLTKVNKVTNEKGDLDTHTKQLTN